MFRVEQGLQTWGETEYKW